MVPYESQHADRANGNIMSPDADTTNLHGGFIEPWNDVHLANHVDGMTQDISGSIAICGLAMRLPGGIRDDDAFWELLYNGKDARSSVPLKRYNVDGFSDRLGRNGAIKTQHGYFLDEDLTCLDTSFFSMTRTELEKIDPQQRQLLEVVRECLESAGEVNWRGKSIGCYVGTFGEDWLHVTAKEPQNSGRYVVTGYGDLMLANRISYEYDLLGPSIVIKTGCSASLVALHEACRALQSGDCIAAVVAGTSLILGPTMTSAMTQEGILSPEGSCKSFDAAADGFARGEAINAVYIKRLDDAIRDKNPLRAIIRSTATNSDGKGQGLMTPNGRSQEILMRKAYRDAKLSPGDTGFVECHGTGTPIGDPIETTAVGNVFGEGGVFIGSVKPNVGHSEGASGITSLIKAILALERKIIPPNIKFVNPNPKIPFDEKNLKVPLQPVPWPKQFAERISINSFGIGGTNVHVIIDSIAEHQLDNSITEAGEESRDNPRLLVFSANTRHSQQLQISKLEEYLKKYPARLSDLAYTLSAHREHLPYRAFSVATNGSKTKASSPTKVSGAVPQIAMIFSGQGAQWPGMGSELIREDIEFRKDILAMDLVLKSLRNPPTWTIEYELQKAAESSQLHKAELAQPLCTAVQIGLFNALARCGVQPNAVIGHSSGEIAAAYASGVLSMDEAIIIAYYRGYITKNQTKRGGMAALSLESTLAAEFLEEGVEIACENSPASTTISGDIDRLEKVINRIKRERPDVLVRSLKVDMAYHSYQMRPLGHEYRSLVKSEIQSRNLLRQDPKALFISSVTGEVMYSSEEFGPAYWESNLVLPVRFHSAVDNLLQRKHGNIFLEIGPHSTLAGPLRQICTKAEAAFTYIPTMLRNNHCNESLLSAFGQLFQHGVPIDFALLIPPGKALIDLPAYSWEHNASYWSESRVSRDWRFRDFGHHALLGQRVPESTGIEPLWRNMLYLEDEPWLIDHKIRGDVVLPLAAYMEMAGEAIRQVTGVEMGYSLRHIVARTALVLNHSKPNELITSLRPHRLTDLANSAWFDFTISSFSGSNWIKHCEGRVKPLMDMPLSSCLPSCFPRKVAPVKWYKAIAEVGMVYGPFFQGLSSITSATMDKIAAAEISSQELHLDNFFRIHPASIDACLQLGLVALVKGQSRNMKQPLIPTMIEELDVSRNSKPMHAIAQSSGNQNTVEVKCFVDGNPTLRLSGLHITALNDQSTVVPSDPHAAAWLEWYPDFDFMDIGSLFKPPTSNAEEVSEREKLCLLCMLDSEERLKDLNASEPYFDRYRDWLRKEITQAELGDFTLVPNAAHFAKLPRPRRLELIKGISSRLSAIPGRDAIARGIIRICDNAEALFTKQVSTIELLMSDNLLTEIYDSVSFGHQDFIRMLSNQKPYLRILEVGAGTGGTTELILKELIDFSGYSAYSNYTYTDISAGFFPQAMERFRKALNMDFKVFDISQNPIEQGFEAASYDLILAPNVIHATPCLQKTLKNLHLLLRQNGHLVLTEICTNSKTPGYIFGNFSGWWLGEADGRLYEPYVPIGRWDYELKAAGFTGVENPVYDAKEPYGLCIAVVTQPQVIVPQSTTKQAIVVVCEQPDRGVSLQLINHLKQSGYIITNSRLGDFVQQGTNVISILDLETPFFESITPNRLLAFQQHLRQCQSQKYLWLTNPAQVLCKDPRSAQSIGTARTIRSELGIPFCTLEIDLTEPNFSNLIVDVFEKICNSDETESLAPDREFVVSNGVIKIGRYRPLSLQKELREDSAIDTIYTYAKTLEIAVPGQLKTLHWIEESLPDDLDDCQVEIETRAVGLNFRDVMSAMGHIFPSSSKAILGLEVAGAVRRIGPDVHDVAVGDRVFALAANGCITTNLVVTASLCSRIPDEMSFEEAVSMPLCYCTAIQSLIEVGQLQKDQTVLIHSACGGVGLAAIHICKMIGIEIFATVSTDKKVQYLVDCFGIPRDHIFNSRSESFFGGLMQQTGERGVDVVLNSLAGELLHASWRCVAEFGKLIELGKRDLASYGQLEMQPFLANRSYCCVDIAQFIQKKPAYMKQMLQRCLEWYQQGHIGPIRPTTLFQASEVESGFRYLQKGDHLGKVVIQIPEDSPDLNTVPQEQTLAFDPEASYLLVGGLGGLGKSTAVWMIEHGARFLVFLSRQAGLKEKNNQAFFGELHSMGCSICLIAGSVQNMIDVKEVIAKSERPIKGIIQLAMVLRDAPFLEMTHEDWQIVNETKIDGTWNLHNAFLNETLDFFVLASSTTAVLHQPGQSNYNAANTFLEAFCQYRHSLGLPASVLNISPINDVGFVAESPIAKKKLQSQGFYFLGEQEFLDFLKVSILNSQPPILVETVVSPTASWKNSSQIIMGLRSELPLNHPKNRVNWRRDRRMAIYHVIKSTKVEEESVNSDKLKEFLSNITEEPDLLSKKSSAEFLAHEIGQKVFDFMLKPEEDVDISLSLADIGLDSLMATELQRWWQQVFGLPISVLEIMASGTLESFGKMALNGIGKKLEDIRHKQDKKA